MNATVIPIASAERCGRCNLPLRRCACPGQTTRAPGPRKRCPRCMQMRALSDFAPSCRYCGFCQKDQAARSTNDNGRRYGRSEKLAKITRADFNDEPPQDAPPEDAPAAEGADSSDEFEEGELDHGRYARAVERSVIAYDRATRGEGKAFWFKWPWLVEDDVPIDRWANEVVALLRSGTRLRAAIDLANEADAELGPEDPPWVPDSPSGAAPHSVRPAPVRGPEEPASIRKAVRGGEQVEQAAPPVDPGERKGAEGASASAAKSSPGDSTASPGRGALTFRATTSAARVAHLLRRAAPPPTSGVATAREGSPASPAPAQSENGQPSPSPPRATDLSHAGPERASDPTPGDNPMPSLESIIRALQKRAMTSAEVAEEVGDTADRTGVQLQNLKGKDLVDPPPQRGGKWSLKAGAPSAAIETILRRDKPAPTTMRQLAQKHARKPKASRKSPATPKATARARTTDDPVVATLKARAEELEGKAAKVRQMIADYLDVAEP